ncbi:MAG: CPBP family intramembrane glutamic endopeptidase [Candidatus Helarchaeota archaeon]
MENKKHIWINIILLISIIVGIILIFHILDYFNLINPPLLYQRYLINIGIYTIMLSVTIFFILRYKSFKKVGFVKKDILKNILFGIIGGSGFLVASLIFFKVPQYNVLDLIILFGFTIIVGITEESIFRGFVQTELNSLYKSIIAILITSVLFAAVHMPRMITEVGIIGLIGMVSFTILGIIIGHYRRYSNSIISVILLHAFWDYWLLIYMPPIDILSLPESELLNLATFLLSGVFLAFGFLLLGLLLCSKFINHNEFDCQELKKILTIKIKSTNKKIEKIKEHEHELKTDPWLRLELYLETKIKQLYEDLIENLTIENVKEFKKIYKLETKIKKLVNIYYHSNSYVRPKYEMKIRYYEAMLGKRGREKFDFFQP